MRLCNLKAEFEKTAKLNLYDDIIRMESSLSDEMLKTGGGTGILESVADGVSEMTEGFFDLSTFSWKKAVFTITAIPLVLGLGIFTGGGIPLILASIVGGGILAGVGGAAGGLVRGLMNKNKQGAVSREDAIADITGFINSTAEAWCNNLPKYLEDISGKFIDSLLDSIKSNQKTIEKDISELQFTSELDSKQHDDELEKLRVAKAGFSVILEAMDEVRSIKIDTAGAEQNA